MRQKGCKINAAALLNLVYTERVGSSNLSPPTSLRASRYGWACQPGREARRLVDRSSKREGGLFESHARKLNVPKYQKDRAMDAPTGHDQNADQVAYWNGPAGQRWAERQAAQDVLLKPVADILIDRARPVPGERVIDVGCGSGATSIAFAQKVTPAGHVFGIDISGPMLERARQSA